ncbi:hypothetical protein F2Q68_00011467 [Brassica cretica]|uniref:Putative plant transposon protein domain-containing protein n=1 Tax=Brassica cretica TaxID=69181 RepID=A0A8S9KS46_BRACR|nr:hypothetical protein F2Q68_00011467 [Brassica cretica]
MSMNKSTSAAGKSSNPSPLNLIDCSDDEEQTTPQQCQTSQPLSEDLHTAAEQLDPESDVESEPVGSTRKKKNVKEERSKQSSEAIPEGADATKACKENRGKAIEVSSGESEEEDDLENTDSYEAEEVDAEDVEPPISVKEKEKKRKAPSSATQSNPVRKSTRKTSASGIKSQAKAKTTSGAKRLAEQRYASFASREIIPERSVDLSSEDTWGYLSIIKKGKFEKTVTGLGGYIPEIMKEFYASLPGEMTRGSKVIVTVRGQKYEFSPAMIDQYFNVSPLEGEELEVEATMDEVNCDELADFLTEGTREMKNLTTSFLSPCKAVLLVLVAYNWVPSSNKNAVSIDRAKLIYKMFHGIRVDVGEMFYAQILNLAVLQKEGGKKDTRWLILPLTIFGVLQTQFELERKPREKLSPVIPYKKDARLGDIYLKNQEEEREAAKKAQRQARKKGKTASTSTTTPPSGPPPSTPRSERTAPSGYVPPRQSPRAAGKFQIIHLGSIAVPEQPIDAEEAKLALDTTSEAIQHLATVMQTLTNVVGQIASMLFPRGEEETDVPQQQDDQGNFIMGE